MDDRESIQFSEDEIQDELARLGYKNVPNEKLREFKRDLQRLIQDERSKNSSFGTSISSNTPPELPNNSGSSYGAVRRERLPLEKRRPGRENWYGTDPISFSPDGGLYTFYDRDAIPPSLSDDVSETDSERRMVKRKTLRKNDKGSKFIDESMTESDAGSIADTNERLQRLALRDFDVDIPNGRRSRSYDAPYRLPYNDSRPASVILRPAEHPHTRNLQKCDPVAKYQQMKQVWDLQKAPGEDQHKGLRWNIREQMLSREVLRKRPQKTFVSNNYVVPTDKRRQGLRWQIRMDLAQGNKPPVGFFHEY